jgi:hypothetical protein
LFSRVIRRQPRNILPRGATAPAWDKAKKADLAAIAERETTGTGWLPELLRKAA